MHFRGREPRRSVVAGLKLAVKWLVRPKTLFLDGTFTRKVVQRYCRGIGCEVGPGINPQTDPRTTFYVDRYQTYGATGQPMNIDVAADASALPFGTGSLDYVFSSHMLEHCPNTLKVLQEWLRVLRPGGRVVLRLPHRDRMFDHDRPLTSLEHHIADLQADIGHDDRTHMEEFIRLVVERVPMFWAKEARRPDGSYDADYILEHGHIHHHVWTQNEIIGVLRYLDLRILFVIDQTLDRADSFLVVAEKPVRT